MFGIEEEEKVAENDGLNNSEIESFESISGCSGPLSKEEEYLESPSMKLKCKCKPRVLVVDD